MATVDCYQTGDYGYFGVERDPDYYRNRGPIRPRPVLEHMVGRPVDWKKFEPMQKIGHSGKSRKKIRNPCAAIGTTSASLLQNHPTISGAQIITGT